MVAIREFYRKLADDEGTVQFYANHPSKQLLLLKNRTVSRFRVHFLTRFNLYCEYQPVGTNLWIRIQTVFQIISRSEFWIRIRTVFQNIFHYRLGSGFEPLSTLLPHFGYGSGFEPFSIFSFHCVLGSGFEPLS